MILWFHVVHLQSNTQTQRFCLPKHPKTAHPTCLTKRCAESGTPCQSHFSGVLGSSGKKWPNGPNFSPLQIENYRPWYCWCMKSNVTQVIMLWTRPTMCGLNTATLKAWTSGLSQVSICGTQGPWSGYPNCMWHFSFEVSYVNSSFSEMVSTPAAQYISLRILRF